MTRKSAARSKSLKSQVHAWDQRPGQQLGNRANSAAGRLPLVLVKPAGHYPATFPAGFQTATLTPELITRLLITAIRSLTDGQPAILVGHSPGGFAALVICLLRNERPFTMPL